MAPIYHSRSYQLLPHVKPEEVALKISIFAYKMCIMFSSTQVEVLRRVSNNLAIVLTKGFSAVDPLKPVELP